MASEIVAVRQAADMVCNSLETASTKVRWMVTICRLWFTPESNVEPVYIA